METHFYLIVVVAIAIAAVGKWRGFNAAIPLILGGLALEFLIPSINAEAIDPELVLTLVLAPLVFAAGLSSSAVDLRRVRRSVLLLAVVLVVITTLVIGGIAAALVTSLSFGAACALGAILAPTDAVAAGSVAKKTGLPARVQLVIEGESLANDGTALTILRVAVVAATVGSVTVLESSKILLLAVVGGVAVGVLGGMLVSFLMKAVHEPVVANAILLITPFILYEVSEQLEGSGLLTLVVAGVWISHTAGTKEAFQSRLQAISVWSLINFLLEALAFCLVGVELFDTAKRVSEEGQGSTLWLILLLGVALFVIRGLFMGLWYLVGPKVAPSSFTDRKSAAKEFVAVALLGVRGPVSVLAAFSLPTDFPGRDLVLTLTFGVVIFSLCCTSFAAPIIRLLRLNTETDAQALALAKVSLAKAALKRLDEMVVEADLNGEPVSDRMVSRVRSSANRRIDIVSGEPEKASAAEDRLALQRQFQREMLHAERDELHRLQRERGTPGPIIRQLTHDIDVREAALR